MAGELTHIIPTHPSDPNYRASKTTGIIWCDANGVAHTITAVYWSPTNNVNDRKLIWQLSNYVPYDNTCTAIISLTSNRKGWIVTVEKNGEDVTSSFATMIPWIYNANNVRFNPKVSISTNTVDLSTFERGEYRLDVSRITSKVGSSSYFPSSSVVSAPDHIYIGGGNNLVAGTESVAIEYDLTNALFPVTVNSIEIFTDSSNEASTTIKIINEDGTYAAAVAGGTIGTQEERFGLTGYSRSVDNLSTTLDKGKKYYIVYNDGWQQAYYPSYFQNETGKYKLFYDNTSVSQITIFNPSQIQNYKGTFGSSSMTDEERLEYFSNIFSLSTNDRFLWLGQNYSANNNVVLKQNTIHRLKQKTYSNTGLIDITSGDSAYKGAKLFGKLGSITVGFVIGYVFASYGANKILKIASGYSSQITLNDSGEPVLRTTLPDSPVNGGIYYIDRSLIETSSSGAVLACYQNGSWEIWTEEYRIDNATDEVTDIWNDIEVSDVTVSIAYNFTNTSVSIDKHFYLKINGMEV